MSRLGTVSDATNALREQLSKAHKPYAGARFRAAFLKEDSRFLTGSVLFGPEEIPSRPIADYGVLLLADEWKSDWKEALDLLSQILSGEAGIAGQKIKAGFSCSDFDHRPTTSYGRLGNA